MQTHDVDCLLPDWPAPAGVRALFSCRDGGTSVGRYAGLNLGMHVGDDPATVQSNRARLQARLGVPAVFLDQVHGTDMVEVAAGSPDAMPADGAYAVQSDVACTVMVADCLPVLFCDTQGRQVAAAHAGWRGLLGLQGRGVLEAAVGSFGDDRRMASGDSPNESLMAWLGPCIGPQAFEVGDEVRAAFVAQSADAAACFAPFASGKWLADLPALARQRLQALGVTGIYGNDGSQSWCTVANPSRFFSHRRDGVSGRMAACIWRVS
ncbi:peptidoglycan editing factor PgeF [Rhodoferax lacus]|uniref:Purine nucleoside phosphorylase n=1 Tax=Rhodoferax lacus TaxID=2184758 RepID=A0A3E1RHK0_9BURK|nr:peptidoglycan editing factor PgeF [Rhodoferax lacus]RFO98723.1 peptidoglycan editing factor PgeF [Rhodoferax lacus]